MTAVAVYSDADADALHVRLADDAVRIGPPPPTESYLRIDAIIDAASATGRRRDPSRVRVPRRARGLRPGRHRCRARLHRPDRRDDRGPRRQARGAAARAVGRGPDRARDARAGAGRPARRAAGRSSPTPSAIGFPLLVKAAAGGGGRGMRRVERAADLPGGAGRGGGRGGRGVRRWGGLPGARDPARAPHRGPAARRRDGRGRRDRGARLLDPAPPPEARRGGAGTRV